MLHRRRSRRPPLASGRRLAALATAGLAATAAVLALRDPAGLAATSPPLRATHGAVASDHPLASDAGLAALRAGGNAVDAACATALALGVVNPNASGIGGGGFALVYLAGEKRVYALDFRERAPAAIKPELFLRDGKLDPTLSVSGGLAVGVPGEVRGLAEMVRRWGVKPFARCIEPAERLARGGFPVSPRLASQLAAGGGGRELPRTGPFADAFFAGGAAPREGEILKRSDLAGTLARLRQAGADAFYTGPIADAIVSAVRGAGGVLSADDLRSYKVVDRKPLEATYRGLRIEAMPPSSSGGVAVIEILGVLEARASDLTPLGRGSSAYLHLLAEAFKHAFADRARHLGDTDFVKVPVERLVSTAYHRELAARIKDGAVLRPEAYGTPDAPATELRDHGTTHLSVVDAEGNAVALTTTINLGFGSRVVAGKTGVLLNDQIDDFSLEPGVPNAFGLVGNRQNAVAPGKRPLSSMSPTIVLEGDRVKAVLGAAGGPTIITATAQVLLDVLDWKLDARAATSAPRIHHQWMPETLLYETDIPRDVIENLEKRGHKTKPLPFPSSCNLVLRGPGGLEAASDPRASGAPAGY